MDYLTELQDRARAKIDNLPRSEQLIILKYARQVTSMEGRMLDIDDEIRRALKTEKENQS